MVVERHFIVLGTSHEVRLKSSHPTTQYIAGHVYRRAIAARRRAVAAAPAPLPTISFYAAAADNDLLLGLSVCWIVRSITIRIHKSNYVLVNILLAMGIDSCTYVRVESFCLYTGVLLIEVKKDPKV